MNNKNITEFLQDILLGKFLVNFVPGLILYYVLSATWFMDIDTGDWLLSFLIVTSISWTLGALEELIFFRKAFLRRWQEGTSNSSDNIVLMAGKIGIALLIACIFWIDLQWVLNLFDYVHDDEMVAINYGVKFGMFFIGGGFLVWMYSKHAKRS